MSLTFVALVAFCTPSALIAAYVLLDFVVGPYVARRQSPIAPGLRAPAPPRWVDDGLGRALAYQRLLRQPDERPLVGKRRHRLTHAGSRDRFSTTWVPATRVWTHHRHTALAGPLEGWRPATTARTRGSILRGFGR